VAALVPGPSALATALKGGYAAHGEASQTVSAALPNLMSAIRAYNDTTPATLRIIGLGSSVGAGATLPDSSTQAPVRRFAARLVETLNKLGNLSFATANGSVNGTTVIQANQGDYAAAKTAAGGPPTVVLLCYGMNDGMPAQYHAGQTYPGAYSEMKKAIAAVIADGGDPIVVTTPHPHSTRTSWDDTSYGARSYSIGKPALGGTDSVITADWSGTGVNVPASYRHARVNQAFRRAAIESGVPVLDAEKYWFRALATYGENALFGPAEFAHPNLLGHQQSYWPAIDDLMRGLTLPTLWSARSPP
jgi:hypothetical protein